MNTKNESGSVFSLSVPRPVVSGWILINTPEELASLVNKETDAGVLLDVASFHNPRNELLVISSVVTCEYEIRECVTKKYLAHISVSGCYPGPPQPPYRVTPAKAQLALYAFGLPEDLPDEGNPNKIAHHYFYLLGQVSLQKRRT